MTTTAIQDFPVRVMQLNGDWTLSVEREITDAQAAGITFNAKPAQVVLGAFVQVIDAKGIRIGHLASGTYTTPRGSFEPAYVVCTIELT